MKLKDSRANAIATNVLADLDAGSGPATIQIYTGTQPATPDTAITGQTLLGTLTCSDPSGSVSGRTLTFSAITNDPSADATGTAAWARVADSTGTAVIDLTVSATGGGGDIQFNTTSMVAGVPISVTALAITF